jgi:hypothetical protein
LKRGGEGAMMTEEEGKNVCVFVVVKSCDEETGKMSGGRGK